MRIARASYLSLRCAPNTEALIVGEVLETRVAFGRRRSWLVTLHDDTGFVTLRFFHFNERQRASVRPGMFLRCFGEARSGPNGFEMVHPEYKAFDQKPEPPEPRLTPVYPTTEGLAQKRIADLVGQALGSLNDWQPPDLTPWLGEQLDLRDALRVLHSPPVGTTAVGAGGRAHARRARRTHREHHRVETAPARACDRKNARAAARPATRSRTAEAARFRADGRSTPRHARGTARSRTYDADAPAHPGRRRFRQDRHRGLRGDSRGRARLSDRDHGADGNPGRAALPQLLIVARTVGHFGPLADRPYARGSARTRPRRNPQR